MPTPAVAIWHAVEEHLGQPVPAQWRRVFEGWRELGDVWDAEEDSPAAAEEAVRALADKVRQAMAADRAGRAWSPLPMQRDTGADGRWELIAELGVAAGHDDWWPIAWRRRRSLGWQSSGFQYVRPDPVELRFDPRLSLRRLLRLIREEWPEVQRLLQPSRPIGPRGIALLRFVCLEAPAGLSWRQRYERWLPDHPEYPFKDVRAFTSAFKRHERQLTGVADGLAWWYEPLARLSFSELSEKARGGDRVARRLIRSRREAGIAAFRSVGIPVREVKKNG